MLKMNLLNDGKCNLNVKNKENKHAQLNIQYWSINYYNKSPEKNILRRNI